MVNFLLYKPQALGTNYLDGTGEVALIEEIRAGTYYIPEFTFIAEIDGKIVGHIMFSHFPLSVSKDGISGYVIYDMYKIA